MSSIESGTRVRVVIEGTGYPGLDPAEGVSLNTDSGWGFWALITDPDVQVVPLDPERPTLTREAILRTIMDAPGTEYGMSNAIFALIQAAHPEWTL